MAKPVAQRDRESSAASLATHPARRNPRNCRRTKRGPPVHDPLLQHRHPAIVCMEGARERASAIRYLAVFHRGPQVAGGRTGLRQDILAVSGMHRRVLIGVAQWFVYESTHHASEAGRRRHPGLRPRLPRGPGPLASSLLRYGPPDAPDCARRRPPAVRPTLVGMTHSMGSRTVPSVQRLCAAGVATYDGRWKQNGP